MDSILTRKKGGGGGGLAADVLVNALTDQISLDFTNSGITPIATSSNLTLTNNTYGDLAFTLDTNTLYAWNDQGWYKILNINDAPGSLTGNDSSYYFANDGSAIDITLIATDPEGVPLRYKYTVGGSIDSIATITANDVEQTPLLEGVWYENNVFRLTPSISPDNAGTFSLTFAATDGVNIPVSSISTFTLQFSIENSRYTTLLLKAEATGDNATFVDSGASPYAVVSQGTTEQGTFSPYAPNWSTGFYGAERITLDTIPLPETGDFTLEFWARTYYQGSTAQWIYTQRNGTDSRRSGISIVNGVISLNNAQTSLDGGLVPLNEWFHIAICRADNVGKFFINGQKVTDTGWTSGILQVVGSFGDLQNSAGQYFKGDLANFRVVSGTALYDNDFTPSVEPLTKISGTTLLTHQYNRYKDGSDNDANFTVVLGTPSINPIGVKDRDAEYDPAIEGGSFHGDGTSAHLIVPQGSDKFNLGNNDFTIETWVYYDSIPDQRCVIEARSGTTYDWILFILANGTLQWYYSGSSNTTGTTALKPKQWYHIALTRNGSDWRMYINGKVEKAFTSTATVPYRTPVYIGADAAGPRFYHPGYIADTRIINGAAAYTGGTNVGDYVFDPPTAPLPEDDTYPTFLLHYTNANILDYSGVNDLQLIGDTSASAVQTKYGRSVYFDGSGDYLKIRSDPAFTLYGDFTIEFWMYSSLPTSGVQGILANGASSFSGTAACFTLNQPSSPGKVSFYCYPIATGSEVVVSDTISADTWTHIAVSRVGTTINMYQDGVYKDTYESSATVDLGGTYFRAGTYWGNNFTGYIEDLRITNGFAHYSGTTSFTPPGALKG